MVDAFSRRIVGHQASANLHTVDTTLPALRMAVKTRGDSIRSGLIMHSDGGGQYYAKDFLDYTSQLKMQIVCAYAWRMEKLTNQWRIKNNYLRHRTSHFEIWREVTGGGTLQSGKAS
ncbi:MAG: hypothetical protein IPJ96_02265 [Bacteroidetes bacterium]|nr:hypothetical protein [Bacteroidota bacterium]